VQGGQVGLPATPTKPVTLVANMRASLKAAHGKVEVALLSADQMHRELAWREGKLAFYGETLEYAAAEFARYSDTRIVFADTRLANAPITGLFAANNPAGFSRAVAEVFGAQVRLETRKKIVIASED
jgi:transmembrane sensor